MLVLGEKKAELNDKFKGILASMTTQEHCHPLELEYQDLKKAV